MLTAEQRRRLLEVARTSIAAALDNRRAVWNADEFEPALQRPAGVFVTLHENGDLRGCIGSIQAVAPMFEAVANSAFNAAFRDPRFLPLRGEELDRIELEISVMSELEQVTDVAQIEVGRDGLIVSRGGNAGLLLPQVATEYGWDRETLLQQTCRKAGLASDAWRDAGTRIEKFSAEVFSE